MLSLDPPSLLGLVTSRTLGYFAASEAPGRQPMLVGDLLYQITGKFIRQPGSVAARNQRSWLETSTALSAFSTLHCPLTEFLARQPESSSSTLITLQRQEAESFQKE
ncbi:hypothetical protein, partial [Azotobacter salinestris]